MNGFMLADGQIRDCWNGGELVSAGGLAVDELAEKLMEATMGSGMACSLCGAWVEAGRVSEYTANVHPKLARAEAT